MLQLREKASPAALRTKRKSFDYYSKTKYSLGYTFSKPETNVLEEASFESILAPSSSVSNRDSDYSLRRMFQQMTINMVSAITNLN